MYWLVIHYPHLNDTTLLRLYNDLSREDEWQWQQASEPSTQGLQQVKVILYSQGSIHHE